MHKIARVEIASHFFQPLAQDKKNKHMFPYMWRLFPEGTSSSWSKLLNVKVVVFVIASRKGMMPGSKPSRTISTASRRCTCGALRTGTAQKTAVLYHVLKKAAQKMEGYSQDK
jgi:hypothetical protein